MNNPADPKPAYKQNDAVNLSTTGVQILASMDPAEPGGCNDPADRLAAHERPGYKLMRYVSGFIDTPVGPAPRVKTRLDRAEWMATARVRCGISRFRYVVAPGLYAVGTPDRASEVLVTANFKLTFDHLRTALPAVNAWILVLDTRGINVWCAAGKGTFATQELVQRVRQTHLERVVSHKRLIVPQLGAIGVSAWDVRKQVGFRVVFGPVRARDIAAFLANGRKATPAMRAVTFSFYERLILTPVELQTAVKPCLITALVLLLLSGIGPGVFSFSNAWERGLVAIAALATGLVSGAVVTPALLPYIPFREFALKGIVVGSASGLALIWAIPSATTSASTAIAIFLFTVAISSVSAMNFTGATPFTSPSGVEKEMKRYIPVQLICLVMAAGLWIYAAF